MNLLLLPAYSFQFALSSCPPRRLSLSLSLLLLCLPTDQRPTFRPWTSATLFNCRCHFVRFAFHLSRNKKSFNRSLGRCPTHVVHSTNPIAVLVTSRNMLSGVRVLPIRRFFVFQPTALLSLSFSIASPSNDPFLSSNYTNYISKQGSEGTEKHLQHLQRLKVDDSPPNTHSIRLNIE
jgi:hypothetical protein